MNEMNLNYQEIKNNIRTRFQNMQTDYVAIGYYLRQVLNNELYLEDGYKNIHEFAQAEFGMKKANVNHCIRINMEFSVGGDSPVLDNKYSEFSKSQLQELLYIPEDRRDEVTPDMTVREIREMKEERLDVEPEPEPEPVSILGYPLRVYPEGSLLSTPGCGKNTCFSCHRGGCEIRQEECYCVEAPMGNPFPCTTLNVVDNLRNDIGDTCQFVNEDLAFHRSGDGQPVPCCKKCDNPCGYECRKAVEKRHAEKTQQEEICDVAHDESIEEKHGTAIDELDFSVRTHNVLKRAGIDTVEELQSMSDVELSRIRNFSQRCMDEVHSKLEEYVVEPDEAVIKIDISVIKHDDSVTNTDDSVIDADYQEVVDAAENTKNPEMCCEDNSEPEDVTYSEIAIRDYLYEEERTLEEYERVNGVEKLPQNLMMRQRMLVKALRLLLESEAKLDEEDLEDMEEDDVPEQPELPVLKNNDQRKEWLNDYKSWGIWYRDENIDVNYYKYDFSDGSRLVVAEYPQRRRYWNPKELEDAHYYHLLEKNRKYYGSEKTFEQPYMHDTDSETYLVEFLKNLQRGGKK